MGQLDRMGKMENNSKPDKSLKINIVRHAPSSYRQPEWRDVETADDINTIGQFKDGEKTAEEIAIGKKEAEKIIRDSAEKIIAEIGSDEEVVIWSSPTGRTLETAKVIREVLREKGIKLKTDVEGKDREIKIFEKLGEVKNFRWELFEPLMNGGEVYLGEKKFTIEKGQSNPDNLGYPDYFTSDAIKKIPAEIKKTWPKEYVKEIESFESFAEASKRMTGTLKKVKAVGDKNYRIIMVTHDTMTGSVVKTFTKNELSGINPGEFVSLERVDDKLVVKRVGNITEGNSEEDVVPK